MAETIDSESLLVPIHEGRELFIAQNQRSTENYVLSLLDNGEARAALGVIHNARTQMLRSLQWQENRGTL